MGEESEEVAPKEEAPKKETAPKKEKAPKVKKERAPREGPILQFTGPEGTPKIVALMAALSVIFQGSNMFWAGIEAEIALDVFAAVMLVLLGLILILLIDILNFGDPTLKKIEIFEKYYGFPVLLIMSLLILLFEFLSVLDTIELYIDLGIENLSIMTVIIGAIFGGLLLLIAAILEFTKDKDKMKPSKLIALVGCIIVIIEAIVLFGSATEADPLAPIWDGIVGFICVFLLLASMYEKIKFIPYQWWMVLILGFVMMSWVVPGVGGRFVMISFIIMLVEK